MQTIDKLRTKLKNSKPSIGTWMQLPSPEVAEILSSSNSYDWIVVDMEHGTFSRDKLPSIIRSIELNSVLPFARLESNNISAAKHVIDCGFQGFIIPMIENKKELKGIYEYINYPPFGKRGVGFSRSNQYGINFKDKVIKQSHPFLVAMIETKLGLENLKDILSFEFLDAVLIGPYDLSASLGVCGDFESKKFKKAVNTIKDLCKLNDIPFGIHLIEPCENQLKRILKDGYKFIVFSLDSVMLYSSKPSLLDT
tara:strand:- start:572 stop:1330 length:759 start_codon:yes stop_codon:yes gene_type:complete